MNGLLGKLEKLFHRYSKEGERARHAGEALRILENAIEYLQQYGCGKDLEYSRARIILQGRIDAIWADYGYLRKVSPARVS